MKALGICCGASTITLVELERKARAVKVIHVASRAHDGNPKQAVDAQQEPFVLQARRLHNIMVMVPKQSHCRDEEPAIAEQDLYRKRPARRLSSRPQCLVRGKP